MTDTDLTASGTAAAQGPVTLDDVRAALADTDANDTNAGAVRRTLGRGSLSTIQKHLDSIRKAGMAQALEVVGVAPDAPKDLIAAVWSSAWAAAQARTAGALASAQTQQQATAAALAVAEADAAAAQQDADEAMQALAQAQEQATQAQEAHAAALAAEQAQAEAERVQHAAELEQARAELERVKIEAAQAAALAQAEASSLRQQLEQAAELAKRDAQIKDAAHQRDREHMLDQLAELKAVLYHRTLAAPTAAPATAEGDHTDI